ncbi:hypothetical protein KFL_000200410 [Klebsormidium nitens]|uniref:F-box domain-containing protein n=1 Tax=Klebsormidium nitens TaxID=105231 RepID=A0A1Y1HNX5_KLENI|nr:hypothetical protein KFL_000200410 [Klebsormidium nitens]|eukprot:GAQ78889.1 hypothetical protein KFL_000200410 [Klebsormidium nitens]
MAVSDSDDDDLPLSERRNSRRECIPLSELASQRKGAKSKEPSVPDAIAVASKPKKSTSSKIQASQKRAKMQPPSHVQGQGSSSGAPVRSSPRQRSARLSSENSPLTALPWEVQLKILREVCLENAAEAPRLVTVCSLWRQLEDEPSVWKRIDVPRGRRAVFDDSIVERYTSKGTWAELEKLNLKGTRISNKGLACLSECCPSLTDVNLADCKGVNSSGVLDWARKQSTLRALTLSRADHVVRDAIVKALVVERPEITYLRLKGCEKVGSVALRAIANGLPHLRVLDLTGAGLLRAKTIIPILLLQANCRDLEILRLSRFGHWWEPWANLEEGGAALRAWDAKVQSLQYRDEPRSHQERLAQSTDAPESSEAGSSGAKEKTVGFPKLRELRVSPNWRNSIATVRNWGSNFSSSSLTDSALWQILKGSPELRVLDIAGIASVSVRIMHAIPTRHLEVLDMAGAALLGTGGIEVAVERWGRSLTSLDVSHCANVRTLHAIHHCCRALRRLNVSYTAIGEDDLRAILSNERLMSVLTSVDASGCRSLPRDMRLPGDSDLDVLRERLGVEGRRSGRSKEKNAPRNGKSGRRKSRRGAEDDVSEGRPAKRQGSASKGGERRATGRERSKKRVRAFGEEEDSDDDSDYTPGKREPEDCYAWD